MAHGKRAVVLAYCWSGDPAQGARVLEPLTRFGRPLGQVGGVMPYAAWQQTFDSHAPAGDHYYWTTSQFDTLADALVDVLVPLASAPPDYDCEVHVHHLGGAVARVGQGATAFAHRDVGFFVNAIGRTRVAERLAGIRDWTRAMRSALAPYARDDVQPNFAGEMTEASTHAHDDATRAKLVALRERYDPQGLLTPVRA